MEWMLLPLKRYADFEGRSRRMEYWMFGLLNLIVYMALGVLMLMGGFSMETGFGPMGWLALGLMFLWGLATIVPAIAVQVRRFHDQDKSGWLFLINFIPYIGGLITFVFMLLPGTSGDNRFGPDPKA